MTQVFYRSPRQDYPTISHGSGIYLWDSTGQRYLDGSSGALVVNIGHGRREVVDAMAAQAGRVAFAHTMRFTSDVQEQLGALIAARLAPVPYYTYFVSGGSEAIESAIKLARQYHLERGEPRRTKIMARWASYHGNTLGALAASGHLSRRRPYAPLLADSAFPHFLGPVPHHPNGEDCYCLTTLESRMQQEDPDTIAALVIEVVGGSALSGFIAHPGYFRDVQALCRRHRILVIVDEVMTGMGRTGEWWAHTQEGLEPDLIALAKGLASGYSPLGAVVAHQQVWDTIRVGSGTFIHGLTYGGNPVSAAAGAAVMTIMERENLVRNARRQGAYLAQQLAALVKDFALVTQVRGRGLMQGLVLRSVDGQPGEVAKSLGDDAFHHGLIIYPGSGAARGVEGDHVLIAPPLTITSTEIDELLDGLRASLQRVQRLRGG